MGRLNAAQRNYFLKATLLFLPLMSAGTLLLAWVLTRPIPGSFFSIFALLMFWTLVGTVLFVTQFYLAMAYPLGAVGSVSLGLIIGLAAYFIGMPLVAATLGFEIQGWKLFGGCVSFGASGSMAVYAMMKKALILYGQQEENGLTSQDE